MEGFFLVVLYLLQCFQFSRHHVVQPPLQQPRNPAEGFFIVVIFWLQFVLFERLHQLQQPLNPVQVEILSDDDEDLPYIVELPNSDESNPDESASSSSNQTFLSSHSDPVPDLILSPSPFPNQTQDELEDLIYDLIHGLSPFPPPPPNNQSFLRRFLGCFCKPSTST